jgi:hypothetical protein
MYKEDTEALEDLYSKAKLQSMEIYDSYINQVNPLRKSKHPLPLNWEKQVADAEELHKNNRHWQDYKRK